MNQQKGLIISLRLIFVLSLLCFANCAWSEGGKVITPTSDALSSAGQFDQASARLRARYTQYLVESAKALPPNLRDTFLMPDQIQAFVTEVKMQFEYLENDIKQSQNVKDWTDDAHKTAPEIIQGFAESRFAPYDLRESVWLLGLLAHGQEVAKFIGDHYLENRFSSLHDKLLYHINCLGFMDDMALTMLAGSSLMVKDKEDLAREK